MWPKPEPCDPNVSDACHSGLQQRGQAPCSSTRFGVDAVLTGSWKVRFVFVRLLRRMNPTTTAFHKLAFAAGADRPQCCRRRPCSFRNAVDMALRHGMECSLAILRAHEFPNARRSFQRHLSAITQSFDQFAIVHRPLTERRYGHLVVDRECFDFCKKGLDFSHGCVICGIKPPCQVGYKMVECVGVEMQYVFMDEWRKRLRQAMETRGVKMRPLSEQAGLGQTALRDILDRDRVPSIETAFKISTALDCSLDWLMTGKGSSPDGTTLQRKSVHYAAIGMTSRLNLHEEFPEVFMELCDYFSDRNEHSEADNIIDFQVAKLQKQKG